MTVFLLSTALAAPPKIDRKTVGVSCLFVRSDSRVDRVTVIGASFPKHLAAKPLTLAFAVRAEAGKIDPGIRFFATDRQNKNPLQVGDTVRVRVEGDVVESAPAEAANDESVSVHVTFAAADIARMAGAEHGVTMQVGDEEIFVSADRLACVEILREAHEDPEALDALKQITEPAIDEPMAGDIVYRKFEQFRRKQARLKKNR